MLMIRCEARPNGPSLTTDAPDGAERECELVSWWCLSEDTRAAVAAAAAIGPADVMNEGSSFFSNDRVGLGLPAICCPLFL